MLAPFAASRSRYPEGNDEFQDQKRDGSDPAGRVQWPRSPGGAAQPARPLIPVLDAATITARCEAELATVRKQQKTMEARKGAGDDLR